MRLTQATLWGTVFSLIGISGSADPDVISNHQVVNQVIFTVSTIGLAGVIFNQVWPQPLEAVAGLVRQRLPRRADAFLSLRDAARELYEANVGNILGEAARQDAGDGSHPLRWCAYHIAPRMAEMYGRRPPSTVLERIPPVLFTYAHFTDDLGRLMGGDGGDYVDLCVKRDAFRAALPGLGAIPPSEPG